MKLLICTQVMDKNHPILGFFHRWVEEFAKHCEVVHVICLEEGEHTLPENVHVHSLGKESGKNRLKYLWRFYRLFGKLFFTKEIDNVFYHMGAVYNIIGAPFFLFRRLYVTKFYWWKAHGHINLMGRVALWFTDVVVTSTESGFPIETRKRKVVGQAIDTDSFMLPPESARHGLIYVGRLVPIKHLEVFLETYVLLRDAGIVMEIKIIGPLTDELYCENLRKFCYKHDIDPKVFVGSQTQTNLASTYQTAEFFLNPSMTHSMDKTVVEATLCGCIPLTANKAFKVMLQEEGLYIKQATAHDYAARIQTFLSSSTSEQQLLRQKLSERAKDGNALNTFYKRIFG